MPTTTRETLPLRPRSIKIFDQITSLLNVGVMDLKNISAYLKMSERSILRIWGRMGMENFGRHRSEIRARILWMMTQLGIPQAEISKALGVKKDMLRNLKMRGGAGEPAFMVELLIPLIAQDRTEIQRGEYTLSYISDHLVRLNKHNRTPQYLTYDELRGRVRILNREKS